VLACDGLWDWITPSTAARVLDEAAPAAAAGEAPGLAAAARALVQAALDRGSDDNVSVVVVDVSVPG